MLDQLTIPVLDHGDAVAAYVAVTFPRVWDVYKGR